MTTLGIVLFGLSVLILIINFVIASRNIFMIVQFCYHSNSLGKYWSIYLKNGFSGRAIISSTIGIIWALVVYILIIPIIVIRKLKNKNSKAPILKSCMFDYSNMRIRNSSWMYFHSNIEELGFEKYRVAIKSDFESDAKSIIDFYMNQSVIKGKKFNYQLNKVIDISKLAKAVIPILITVDQEDYPTFILYDNTHIELFEYIKPIILELGYKKCLYFSIAPTV